MSFLSSGTRGSFFIPEVVLVLTMIVVIDDEGGSHGDFVDISLLVVHVHGEGNFIAHIEDDIVDAVAGGVHKLHIDLIGDVGDGGDYKDEFHFLLWNWSDRIEGGKVILAVILIFVGLVRFFADLHKYLDGIGTAWCGWRK